MIPNPKAACRANFGLKEMTLSLLVKSYKGREGTRANSDLEMAVDKGIPVNKEA